MTVIHNRSRSCSRSQNGCRTRTARADQVGFSTANARYLTASLCHQLLGTATICQTLPIILTACALLSLQERELPNGRGAVMQVKRLTEAKVASAEAALGMIQQGLDNRKVCQAAAAVAETPAGNQLHHYLEKATAEFLILALCCCPVCHDSHFAARYTMPCRNRLSSTERLISGPCLIVCAHVVRNLLCRLVLQHTTTRAAAVTLFAGFR